MSPIDRLQNVAAHLHPVSMSARDKVLQKGSDDIVSFLGVSKSPVEVADLSLCQVITWAKRTPLTKANKGGLKDTALVDLLVSILTVR